MLLEDLLVFVCKCSVILAQQSLCLHLHGCVNMIDIHVSYIMSHKMHCLQESASLGQCHHCHSSDLAQVSVTHHHCHWGLATLPKSVSLIIKSLGLGSTWSRKARVCVCV